MIKYLGYTVTFQEVPDEITLCFNITNCQHRCPGCHSPELQQDLGNDLEKDIESIIDQYLDGITCVCFMGEGNDGLALARCITIIRNKYPNLKVCIYSGENLGGNWTLYIMLGSRMLDYLKLGPYIQDRGSLDTPNTNQRMYRISYNSDIDYANMEDITYKFWKKGK